MFFHNVSSFRQVVESEYSVNKVYTQRITFRINTNEIWGPKLFLVNNYARTYPLSFLSVFQNKHTWKLWDFSKGFSFLNLIIDDCSLVWSVGSYPSPWQRIFLHVKMVINEKWKHTTQRRCTYVLLCGCTVTLLHACMRH
jgi:hypothetical protein